MAQPTLPDFSARQLEAVLDVGEYGSFIAAAARLRISQPALTRTIKRIETALGVRLFERSTRHVQITPAGREFAAVAERMLNDLRITVRSSARSPRNSAAGWRLPASCRWRAEPCRSCSRPIAPTGPASRSMSRKACMAAYWKRCAAASPI
ncbi:LysR family transcriptional regulator [Reyranella sp.]|uniref:LysR family transcriptional regulator n=1 Tax=Reyranella sp. TaxID=1929291 RepID=UPI003C7BA1F7